MFVEVLVAGGGCPCLRVFTLVPRRSWVGRGRVVLTVGGAGRGGGGVAAVVVVGAPDVELGVQVLAVSAGDPVLEVRLAHVDHRHPVHVPEAHVQPRHRDLKLLEGQHQPRPHVLLAPVPWI